MPKKWLSSHKKGEYMKKNTLVAVSSLPAEKEIFTYVKKIESYAEFLHCDIMDGTITPDKTLLNSATVQLINERSTLPLDVHLMVRTPENYLLKFINAGANIISVHYEAFTSDELAIKCLQKIRKAKCLAGIAIDAPTDITKLNPILKYADIVLVMSVNIGKSGQKFDQTAIEKVKYLSSLKKEKDYSYLIEVDGGINSTNCGKLIKSGADILVSGSYVFNETNSQLAISKLKNITNKK